jgi:two-component system, sensor histidine kinase and response regulator
MINKYKNATVLVVDDNNENLKVVGGFLKTFDYKIAFATNGKEAMDILADTNIDLILLDIMMPGMDGFEVCKLIKQNKLLKNIPIIFLTAKTETDDIVKGFEVGGVDYVTKPFRKEELLCRVNTHLELKFSRETLFNLAKELKESNRFIMQSLNNLANKTSQNEIER